MNYKDILRYFPDKIRVVLENEINNNFIIEEIRIRNSKPIILKLNNSEKIINYIVQTEDVLNILQSICENSIYSYQNQICEGFITIKGGHRIGITGSAVIENNQVKNLNYISNLNFRIARQIIGCSNNIIKEIINKEENTIYNTLIVSPPGAGKTTLLRDIIRNLSNGTEELTGKNIGVVDERGEIAAMYKGIPQNDLGIRTDIIENIKKSIGMKMLIRSMAFSSSWYSCTLSCTSCCLLSFSCILSILSVGIAVIITSILTISASCKPLSPCHIQHTADYRCPCILQNIYRIVYCRCMNFILLNDHKCSLCISRNNFSITHNSSWCCIQDHIIKFF